MASRHNYNYLPRSMMLYDSSSDSSDDNIANEANTVPTNVWVFGYGSLCWNPGFEYSKCVTGYVRGYVRRFWQGNTTHRGTTEKVSFEGFLTEVFCITLSALTDFHLSLSVNI